MTAFLDTSVLAPYYCPEPRSDRVQRTLNRIDNPAISPLVEIEFYCVVARKVRSGQMEKDSARRVLAEFRRHLEENRFRIVPLQAVEYALAGQWISGFSSSLRGVDALHLAASSNNKLTLITSDRILAQTAHRFGVKRRLIP